MTMTASSCLPFGPLCSQRRVSTRCIGGDHHHKKPPGPSSQPRRLLQRNYRRPALCLGLPRNHAAQIEIKWTFGGDVARRSQRQRASPAQNEMETVWSELRHNRHLCISLFRKRQSISGRRSDMESAQSGRFHFSTDVLPARDRFPAFLKKSFAVSPASN